MQGRLPNLVLWAGPLIAAIGGCETPRPYYPVYQCYPVVPSPCVPPTVQYYQPLPCVVYPPPEKPPPPPPIPPRRP